MLSFAFSMDMEVERFLNFYKNILYNFFNLSAGIISRSTDDIIKDVFSDLQITLFQINVKNFSAFIGIWKTKIPLSI